SDQFDGNCRYYSESGQLEHTEFYVLGDDFGTWNYYDAAGTIVKTQTFYNDRQLTEVIVRPVQAPPVPSGANK
ncbi:MAG TPA: hypothetical protein VI731_03565, partial [Bacteroidia bacterium]|nr:hypothetical protein [Bacteroidia bacterium]